MSSNQTHTDPALAELESTLCFLFKQRKDLLVDLVEDSYNKHKVSQLMLDDILAREVEKVKSVFTAGMERQAQLYKSRIQSLQTTVARLEGTSRAKVDCDSNPHVPSADPSPADLCDPDAQM
jgi:endonuclease III-like uncharacterized protein